MKTKCLLLLLFLYLNALPSSAFLGKSIYGQEEDKCLVMSQDFSDGKLKAYGVATSYHEMVARSQAVAYANGELARQLGSFVEFTENYYMELINESGNTQLSDTLRHRLITKTEASLGKLRIACSTLSRQSDGLWRCSVCVVMEEEIAKVLKSLPVRDEDEPTIESNKELIKDKLSWNDAVDYAIEEYLNQK